MEAYTGFAAVYDIFMDNVPYEDWSMELKKGSYWIWDVGQVR